VLSLDVVSGRERLILAIAAGLVVGKPAGMALCAYLALRLGLAAKPAAYSWRQLLGAGALAGIGFTMSLYIAAKAYAAPEDFAAAKLAVFTASLLAAGFGTALLLAAAQVDEHDARGDGERGDDERRADRL
jgi:NhaA family Na+:H+ antiporter